MSKGVVGGIALEMLRVGLTDREQQVAWLRMAGVPIRDIAAWLCMEEQSVKNLLTITYRKCGMTGVFAGGGGILLRLRLQCGHEPVQREAA